jgi:7-cyano-7-deazaguanine synthase
VGYALSIGADRVFYAAHYNDRAIYPDCRLEFVQSQNLTAKLANDAPELEIIVPFIHKTKAELVKIASELEVPFADTWSCYKGGEKACGVCGTCRERIEAFQLNKLEDPIDYEIELEKP